MLSGFCGSVPTTTYGENIGVMAVTKVYSVWVIGGAAVFSIILAFFAPASALIDVYKRQLLDWTQKRDGTCGKSCLT